MQYYKGCIMNEFIEQAKHFQTIIEHNKAETVRQEFVARFNRDKIKTMTLEEYALGRGDNDSFCYWLERKLINLGNITGSPSAKFGVYFDSQTHEPQWSAWTEYDFIIIRNALLDLYDSGEREDIRAIKASPISNMFRGKILSMYFPKRYLNIFSEDHLKYFLDKLGIRYQGITDPIDFREILINYKNTYPVFSSWSALKFGHYLYSRFGKPSKEEIDDEVKTAEAWYDGEQNVEIDRIIITDKEKKQYGDGPIKKPEMIETPLGKTYERNPHKSVHALKVAEYKCEINADHITFKRKNNKLDYTEAHHLIPMKYQEDFEYSLDNPANIVSLCSNCHNWAHYGASFEDSLRKLYELRVNRLKQAGLDITFKKLLKYYR